MQQPKGWPKLFVRVLALGLVTVPGSYLGVLLLSIVGVLIALALPGKRPEFYEVGLGLFMLSVVGPGLNTVSIQ